MRPPPPSCSAGASSSSFLQCWEGREPGSAPVATGSHIDAIPYSGKYDGVVGVLGAIQAIDVLKSTFIMGRERKMKRKRSDEYSLNPPPTIRSLPSQIQSALVIVNKCNKAMELMLKEFSELLEATLLGKGQKKILDIKCRIVFWLEGLFKETSLEGCQNPQTATCLPASTVLGNISSCFPTESHASKVM
ncbi:hypothetical protein V2J09_008419 [Rumex salicifolius]